VSALRTAVVGVRGIGRGHLKSVREHARTELVAVADVDAAAAAAAVEGAGARAYAGLEALLDGEADLDAVVLATPHHLHAPMALAALEAGLHVLVEKPIATRVSDADRMVDVAAARGRVLAVNHQYRTFRGNARLRQILDSGQIGAVQRVVWQWLEARPESYYARDRWRCTFERAGGGVLLNQASHDIDLLCWLFGPPAEVSATVGNRGHEHEVEDTAAATVRFASGVVASLQFSTWDRCLSYRQIDGDAGAVVWQDEHDANVPGVPEVFRLGVYDRPLAEIIPNRGSQLTGRPLPEWRDVECPPVPASLFDSFVTAALDGGEPITSGASARVTTELICAILLAGLRRQVVTFPVDRGAFDDLMDELVAGATRVPAL
jgi:predicted dehydrogenase